MPIYLFRRRSILLAVVALGGAILAGRHWLIGNFDRAPPESDVDEDGGPVGSEPADVPSATPDDFRQVALDVVGGLAEAFPDDPEALHIQAQLQFRLGNASQSVPVWHACIRRDPSFVAAHFGLGCAAVERGDYEEATQRFRRVVALDPKDNRAPVLLGETLMRLGRTEEARTALEAEIARGRSSSNLAVVLGQVYLQLGRFDAARKAFDAAAPEDQRAHYGLATVYARLDEPEKSRRHMEEFRRLSAAGRDAELTRIRSSGDPLSPRDAALHAHIESGRIYLKHGNAEKAEDLWRKAAALDPRNVDCRTELADLYERADRDRDALRVCRQLRAIDPGNADYWLNVGLLHARLRRWDAALSEVEKAMQLDPGNPRYREARAVIRRERSGR
jgi:Flp pilus assembly protein TadD